MIGRELVDDDVGEVGEVRLRIAAGEDIDEQRPEARREMRPHPNAAVRSGANESRLSGGGLDLGGRIREQWVEQRQPRRILREPDREGCGPAELRGWIGRRARDRRPIARDPHGRRVHGRRGIA